MEFSNEFRENILRSIRTAEKNLTKKYIDKWTLYTVKSNCWLYPGRVQYKTAFQIKSIRFVSSKLNSVDFLKFVYVTGKDETGATRAITIEPDNIMVFDSFEAARLFQELNNNPK